MKEKPKGKKAAKKQIKEIREEIDRMLKEPEFEEMSKTFQHALAQRLGMEKYKEGGLVIKSKLPVTIKDIMDQAGIADPGQLQADWPDDPYMYGNIYSYSFW
ncbi:MAG: hypothetical protein JXA42_05845 [Anaerolineales bacterium]|nr:hypothetical protein [Anaerolineales bacterium]